MNKCAMQCVLKNMQVLGIGRKQRPWTVVSNVIKGEIIVGYIQHGDIMKVSLQVLECTCKYMYM